MSLVKIALIAVGLAADALAVSVAEGIVIEEAIHRHTLRVSIMFGLFQGVMPLLGWLLGRSLIGIIGPWDHWVAFGLLVFIGGKMVVDALSGVETERRDTGSRGLTVVMLAVITSIDALAIGITITVLTVDIWVPAAIIGAITAVLCAIGVQAGHRIGTHLGREAEVIGGLVLTGLGVKILLENLL
jgi:putative Mn2+ efflux pump MntP